MANLKSTRTASWLPLLAAPRALFPQFWWPNNGGYSRVDILTRPGGVVDTRLILSFYAFLFYLRKDQARTYHITYDQRQSSTCAIAIAATRASGGTGVDFATRLDSCQPWEIVDKHCATWKIQKIGSGIQISIQPSQKRATQCTSQKNWRFGTNQCGVDPYIFKTAGPHFWFISAHEPPPTTSYSFHSSPKTRSSHGHSHHSTAAVMIKSQTNGGASPGSPGVGGNCPGSGWPSMANK